MREVVFRILVCHWICEAETSLVDAFEILLGPLILKEVVGISRKKYDGLVGVNVGR